MSSIKVERERGFPKDVLRMGFSVNTFRSEASVEIDRKRILNAICGVDADQLDVVEPREDHPEFERVDASLAALFAEAALSMAARDGDFETTVEVLMKDTSRRSVRVDIPDATITSLAALAPAFNSWPELSRIDLDASESANLTDVSALQGLARCEKIEIATLNFSQCRAIQDVADFGRSVGKLQSLKHLQLDFSVCRELSDIADLGSGVGALRGLVHLQLGFNHCSALRDISTLGSGLAALKGLQYLRLDFGVCRSLRDLSDLGRSVGTLHGLQNFHLNVTGWQQLKDIVDLGRGVGWALNKEQL